MRTKNSIRNGILSLVYSFISIIIAVIAQAVFIRTLGNEYNGIKSLFTNILSMLSIAELGFGSAIVYNFYKPLKDNDQESIQSLLKYYKVVYQSVAGIVLILGLLVLPFVSMIVGPTTIKENLYVLFLLFLLQSVVSYLLTYKRSILYADQKNYIINIISVIFLFLTNLFQIIVLLLTQNFILYLILKIIFTILENVAIHLYVNKHYSYLADLSHAKELPRKIKKDIHQKVSGLLFHKIGGFVVTGTDSIIISMTKGLGIVYVGLYYNYYMISNYINTIFSNIFNSLTSSVGNLLVEKNYEKSRSVYKSMLLFNSWIFGLSATLFYFLITPFIKVWIGADNLLPQLVLVVMTLHVYIRGMRKTPSAFKEAGGVFYEDRYIPVIESIVNLVASLILTHYFGLAGVLMGTIISTMVVYIFNYPKYVYEKLLHGTKKEYAWLYFKHAIVALLVFGVNYVALSFITITNPILEFLIYGIIIVIISNILYFIIYYRTADFEFYKKQILRKIWNKLKKRKVKS